MVWRLRPLSVVALSLLLSPQVRAATIPVATTSELRIAVGSAQPGDEIVLAPGDYLISSVIRCDRPGAAGSPITVRASAPGCARLYVEVPEGFKVSAPWWTFEGLDMEGVCANHSTCEHAFHVVGGADSFVLRGSRLHEFNAAIKGNGEDPGGGMVFPDDVLIEENEIHNADPRQTGNPVTPIDIVGGRRWTVRRNFIHDFHKAQGNQISYAAFFKGNSRAGVFEENVVACYYNGSDPGGIRVGLSFGGGGTQPDSVCEGGTCTPEHRNGIMRNNLILNCNDVGVYLNEAQNCQIHNNTLYDTAGIDVRFPASVVDLRNNLLTGRIRTRDGGTMTLGSNLEQTGDAAFQQWFADPARFDFTLVGDGSAFVDQGESLAAVPSDFCTGRREPSPDIGAVEYDADVCDTTAELDLLVTPPDVPPNGPGPTLRVFASANRQDVLLTWAGAGDAYWNLYRSIDPAGLPGIPHQEYLTSPSAADDLALADGTPLYSYVVRAVSPCTGVEAE